MREVLLIVSIDTEEDNWYRSRENVTLENIRELRRLAAFFERVGVRPTYFTTYQVARDPRAAAVLREVCNGRGEIAAHLHPWNTPPLSEAFVPRNSMLKNLPADLQLAKLQTLTTALEDVFGFTPGAFRAGRYGLGRDTVAALERCGYRVDSSVTPFVSWETFDDGPSFVGAPLDAHRLAPNCDVLEIPLSAGFGSWPFWLWRAAARIGLSRGTVLSPEVASVAEMLAISRRLLEHGARHLHVTWHSPSLTPGLSPFTATAADVARLYASVEAYLERLVQMTPLTFATVSEAAAALSGGPRP